MMIRRMLAGLAVGALVACSPLAPATRVEAASSGPACSKWITTYPGFAGVTIYRGHMVCYGKPAAGYREYRSRIVCTLGGQYWHTRYGGWKKVGSGKDSYNSCGWPAQIARTSDIKTETRG